MSVRKKCTMLNAKWVDLRPFAKCAQRFQQQQFWIREILCYFPQNWGILTNSFAGEGEDSLGEAAGDEGGEGGGGEVEADHPHWATNSDQGKVSYSNHQSNLTCLCLSRMPKGVVWAGAKIDPQGLFLRSDCI